MTLQLNCAAVDELDASYAVGALDRDEQRAVSDHLAHCPSAHDELRTLVAAARILPTTLEPVTPSPGTRSRVMATIAATAQAHRAVEGRFASRDTARGRRDEQRARGSWFDRITPWLAPALGAAALAAIVLLGWNLRLQGDLAARDEALRNASAALAEAEAAHTVAGTGGSALLLETRDGGATLVASGMPELESGNLYHMWLLDEAGVPVRAGTFTAADADQLLVVQLAQPIRDHATFAITVEAGVVDAPQNQPIMSTDLAG